MDLYTVILIAESTGDRFILEGVTAEVESIVNYNKFHNASGELVHRSVKDSHLDIVLTIYTGFEFNQKYEQFKQMVLHETLLLSFKDVHPCLIKGRIKGMSIDSQKVTINFYGNSIDKSLEEFITEVKDGVDDWLNAEQVVLQSPEPDPGFKKKVHFKEKKKDKIPKRKLTF